MDTSLQRFFLRIAYDGANYCGWQVQPKGVSIQGEIQEALSILMRTPISIVGAGRTDAGVNAYSMTAHVDLPISPEEINRIRQGLNGILRGKGISIHSAVAVHRNAHARFDATSRRYLYYISSEQNPFLGNHCWIRRSLPNIDLMNDACQYLVGEHDFTSFCKLHSDTKHNRCNVHLARWQRVEEIGMWHMLSYEVRANRFLHGMVRAMVGTLLDIGYGKRPPEEIIELLAAENRAQAGISAPARGLFFVEASYPDSIYL